jgi:DNA-binding NarL/FixJ family response regulator
MGVRVLLAEDQRLMRSGLATMIGLQADMEIVGEADNGRSAVELAQKLAPDIVLMDITMPELNGIDATQQIAALDPPPKIIVLSLHSDQRHVTDALKAGASGYVVKDSPLEDLVLAIRAVCQGRVYLSPQVAGGVLHDYRRCVPGSASPDFATLSAREREVLQLIAEGKSTKAIASALYVSKKTIDTHRAHILTKLHASSVADLVKHAIREGLTSADP